MQFFFIFFKLADPPRNITIISLSWSHVVLNWTSPFYENAVDFADRYRLIIRSNKEKIVITTSKKHARIVNLKQLTNYLLNLQAWNAMGYGPFLKTDIHFRTPGNYPLGSVTYVMYLIFLIELDSGPLTICTVKPSEINIK